MFIGLDIGGTNLKIGVLDQNNILVYKKSEPTDVIEGRDFILSSILSMIYNAINKHKEIKAIGIGVPGFVDHSGYISYAPNITPLENFHLSDYLAQKIDLPVYIDNDAKVAALAEMEFGAGKNLDSFIYVTLGTGVGGAIIINRKIYRGINNGAGELGHLIMDINEKPKSTRSYRTGILEEFIGKNQITAFGNTILRKYPNSILHKFSRPDPYYISEGVSKNDQASIEIFYKIGSILGMGLASAMNLLDIPNIIIGGGLSQAHSFLFDTALETIKDRAIPIIADKAQIIRAFYTKDAGIIGASLLARMNYNSEKNDYKNQD